jgi:hypothetical protein
MIHIFGDSHGLNTLKNLNTLNIPTINQSLPSITMYRIGRDNIIMNFDKNNIKQNDTICLLYGEVDCRCHVKKQVNLGKKENEVIESLVKDYFITIKNNINNINNIKVIIFGVIPPVKQYEYEKLNGLITHEYPFVGTDEERVRITNNMNMLLEQYAIHNNYYYFYPYDSYKNNDGTLNFELSDKICHINDNTNILKLFYDTYIKYQ